MTATARPWGAYRDDDGLIFELRVWTPGGKSVGIFSKPDERTHEDWQDDAKLTLSAINHHDALVSALEYAKDKLAKCAKHGGNDEFAIEALLEPITSILSQVRGET